MSGNPTTEDFFKKRMSVLVEEKYPRSEIKNREIRYSTMRLINGLLNAGYSMEQVEYVVDQLPSGR